MDKNLPIGVIDSGVGGLSVLKCLHSMMPHEDFLYLGDTARTPYGVRPETQIRQFVHEMMDWLVTRGVKEIVIACNTLTMLGVDTLQPDYAVHIEGMSKGAELLVAASRNEKVGVLATPFTISTEIHKKQILAIDPNVKVVPQPCPDFVTLIEKEAFDTVDMQQAIEKYTTPLKEAGVDAIILSCTHFPFIKEELSKALGHTVVIIDPAETTARNAMRFLQNNGLAKEKGQGKLHLCCTAGTLQMQKLSQRIMPDASCTFEQVSIESI